jgi:hypothetical protein
MDEALALAIGAFVLSFVAAVPAYAKRVECRGDRDCPATVHIHGCFAEGRVIPDRYHGSRARMALIELHMREGRHAEAHALVIAELDA